MTRVSQRFSLLDPDEAALGITAAVAAIRAGDLVVMPTDTVYGVAADPFSNPAVDRLLRAKDRGRETPPPVLIGSVAALQGLADDVDDRVDRLVEEFWPGGLSLILRVQPSINWDLGETRDTVMLRMPDHDLTLQLLRRTGPLAVSSANRHGRPPATSIDHAEAELGDRIEVYLDGGPTPGDVPSTILDLTRITPQLLRRGVVTDEMLRELIPSMEVDIDSEPMPGEELLAEWEAEQARLDAEEAVAEEERERKVAAGELVEEEEVPFEPWPEGAGPGSEPAADVEGEAAEPADYIELAEHTAEGEPVDQAEGAGAEPEDAADGESAEPAAEAGPPVVTAEGEPVGQAEGAGAEPEDAAEGEPVDQAEGAAAAPEVAAEREPGDQAEESTLEPVDVTEREPVGHLEDAREPADIAEVEPADQSDDAEASPPEPVEPADPPEPAELAEPAEAAEAADPAEAPEPEEPTEPEEAAELAAPAEPAAEAPEPPDSTSAPVATAVPEDGDTDDSPEKPTTDKARDRSKPQD